jgi:5-methylcytosine-specific restriction endonuclease McrA
MPSPTRKRNGHRWRELERRVLAEETHCRLCDQPVDKARDRKTDPLAAAIDHLIPIHRGGPEYDRANAGLMHRGCNQWKATMTLAEARAKRAGIVNRPKVDAGPGW